MPKKLTQKVVDGLKLGDPKTVRDSALPGFIVRVGKTSKAYAVQREIWIGERGSKRRARVARVTIGRTDEITCDEARERAADLLASMRRGIDPKEAAAKPSKVWTVEQAYAEYFSERPGQTLQPTGLVHEAYLRLMKDRPDRWQNRAHFCAIAAHSMRQILIERARARGALKRGGADRRVTLDEALVAGGEQSFDILALDAALEKLAALDAEQARLVELRFFGGLTVEETASALDIPEATVRTRYFRARGLLRESLARDIDRSLEEAFGFAGERCDRIVARVLERIAAGT